MKILLSEKQYFFQNGDTYSTNYKHVILEKLNLSSFRMQDTLSPDIFDSNEKMLKEVRAKLLTIGKDFYEYLEVPQADLVDIILTGSLANYNWSRFSDVDLHVVIPYKQVSKNTEFVDEYMYTKKELWNLQHDIKIKSYEVELYAQDEEEELVAGGVYSVLYDKWIKKPSKEKPNLNPDDIENFVSYFEGKIQDLLRRFAAGDTYGLVDDIDDLKSAIRQLRKRGLLGGGEFSAENIAFKALRRMGILDRLNDLKTDAYDKEMSIDKSQAEKFKDGELDKKAPPKEDDKPKDKSVKDADGRYSIQGRRFSSLRQAEKALGMPKSTIEYRVKSDNPEFSDYKELDM